MNNSGFSSRIGFIIVSVGCAVGLGNVWRFPFMTGRYGGAAFVVVYLMFLILFGLPIMLSEFAVGRSSQKSAAMSFDALEPPGAKWHLYKYGAYAGNFLSMMFYTVVSGWMPYYLWKMASGGFEGLSPEGVGAVFGALLSDPVTMSAYMALIVALCGGVCYLGVKDGVERVSKWLMGGLFVFMMILAVNSLTLPGGSEGIRYYLYPDIERLMAAGSGEVVFEAMGQAFFTLSLGMGALAIFGSYIGKKKSLLSEASWILLLDTIVALMSGFIIFPACFSYGIEPSSGPNLIFVTLPNVFNNMTFGRFWGALFFLFMTSASVSTVIAIFENLIAMTIDLFGISREKAVTFGVPIMFLLSMPCVLGFNLWAGFQPLGAGTCVLDLEDFLLSNNLLPIGSLVYILFCTRKSGWGWDNFIREVNEGEGAKIPSAFRSYASYILPFAILYLFLNGYYSIFAK